MNRKTAYIFFLVFVTTITALSMVGSLSSNAMASQPELRTSPNTIAIDGDLSDWAADELMGTDAMAGLYITWDATNLYVGLDMPYFLGEDGENKSFYIAIDTDLVAGSGAPGDGYGSVTFNNAHLPEVIYYFAGGAGWYEWSSWSGAIWNWNGWSDAGTYYNWNGNPAAAPGDEMTIPLANLGNPSAIAVYAWLGPDDTSTVDATWPPANGSGTKPQHLDYAYLFSSLGSGKSPNRATLVPSPLLINEVDADQTSTDTAEFVELYDGGVGNLSLDGFVLVFYNGSNDLSYASFDLTGHQTSALGYFVVCGSAAVVPNCNLDVTPDTNLIQNGQDAVALYQDSIATFPTNTPVRLINLVDALVYDTGQADDSGLLVLLNPGQPQINENEKSTGTIHSMQRCPDGSGGARNTYTYDQFLPTPGAPNTCGQESVIINEVDSDTPGTDVLEFVELFDGGIGNVKLDGLVVVFYNGSNDLSYASFDLDGYKTGANGYFLLGNALVPGVQITFANNFLQNGQDAVALYQGDAADFPNSTPVTTVNLLDAIVYDTDDLDDPGLLVLLNPGQPQVNESGKGDPANHSNQRCPDGSGGRRNTDTYDQFAPTPGAENTCGAGVEFGVCGAPATLISLIQGAGLSSDEVGNIHVIEGVVIGDYQLSNQLRGFYIQEEDADQDSDPLTSEGIFVYDNLFGVDVAAGDVVRVRGIVAESFGQTQLGSITHVAVCESGMSVTPTPIMLPVTAINDYEPFEGMLVVFTQTLYVTENYGTGRYGEVDLAVDGRLFNPTNVITPGVDAQALQLANDLRRILLDDASNIQNPLPLPPYIAPDGTLRANDSVQGLTGVLGYGFSRYRLQPVGTINFTRENDREEAPPDITGTIKVASFNVLNYFTTIDNAGSICGPSGNMGCRGADTVDEFNRQRMKIITATLAMDAAVVGLIEIENNEFEAVEDLVNGLNDIAGPGTYDYIDTGFIGTDAIKLAIIYQPALVTPVGDFAILDSIFDPLYVDTLNRPALAQTFEANGYIFTVIVNHLKSKGSACAGDPDMGDGQGNCNVTRTNAANVMLDWIDTDPTSSGSDKFLIMGDLNAYAMEDPITALKDGGFTNLVEKFQGLFAYSYVFQGQAGYLDHALASGSMVPYVEETYVWHINSDEPVALDYNNYNQPLLYKPDQYKSSDHDPVIVYLDLTYKIYLPLIFR